MFVGGISAALSNHAETGTGPAPHVRGCPVISKPLPEVSIPDVICYLVGNIRIQFRRRASGRRFFSSDCGDRPVKLGAIIPLGISAGNGAEEGEAGHAKPLP